MHKRLSRVSHKIRCWFVQTAVYTSLTLGLYYLPETCENLNSSNTKGLELFYTKEPAVLALSVNRPGKKATQWVLKELLIG